MARANADADTLVRQFERELVRAKRTAGTRVGTKIVRAQRAKMKARFETGSRRRLAAVKRYVTKRTGTLIIADHAVMARLQEDGGVIGSTGWLRIPLDTGRGMDFEKAKRDGKTFTVRTNDGRVFVMRKAAAGDQRTQRAAKAHGQHGARAFPVAVLKKRTTHRARLGLRETVEAHADDYAAEIERQIVETV